MSTGKTTPFNLQAGDSISGRYTIISQLGVGTEGEVYKVQENMTGIKRALKLFYPEKNKAFKVSTRYAKKLYKLNNCPILMDFYSHEILVVNDRKVAILVCELIEGELLSSFVSMQKTNRLGIFQSIHLLYAITKGVEEIHAGGEYHGDLHTDNIIIKSFGIVFDLKIIDLHHWGDSKKDNREEDVVKLIKIFYEILGGKARYPLLPPSIRYIICGLKRNIILNRFKTATHLRHHLETMDWSDAYRKPAKA